MTRPFYETAQDRSNEQALARIIEHHYRCQLTKMPIKLQLDYMATRDGKAVAFVEMRHRRNEMGAFPTYMVGLHKCLMAKQLTLVTGLPSMLAVRWADAVGITKLPPDEMDVQLGGTVRRGDAQDIEPMVYFDVAKFRVLEVPSGL